MSRTTTRFSLERTTIQTTQQLSYIQQPTYCPTNKTYWTRDAKRKPLTSHQKFQHQIRAIKRKKVVTQFSGSFHCSRHYKKTHNIQRWKLELINISRAQTNTFSTNNHTGHHEDRAYKNKRIDNISKTQEN